MRIRIKRVSVARTELNTRMPFKYGIATMTHLPHLFVAADACIDGEAVRGIASDHLPPKWFTKDPQRAIADEVGDMECVIHKAALLAEDLAAETVFDFWLELHRRMEQWRQYSGWLPLLVHFGTSLIERAVIDAWCRSRYTPFAIALRSGALGLRLEAIHPELRGCRLEDLLSSVPVTSVFLRHTVGLADPIDERDRKTALDDGLPETLVENISAYGLKHFKIKFTGPGDLPRLDRILETIAANAGTDIRFTLDGNESFGSVAQFAATWTAIESLPAWRALRAGLICVEQPMHRAVALTDGSLAELRSWRERPSMIIDESDAEFDSVRHALDGGYVGTSHKNCKGVFRGVANACLLARRRIHGHRHLLQTGEDLANIGPIALLQDLAVQGTLGIESVERNGHHYFRGLSSFPENLQRQMIDRHGDLYHWHPRGFATLAPTAGRIQIGSVTGAPFGLSFIPDLALGLPRKNGHQFRRL